MEKRYKRYEPQQNTFITFEPEQYFPAGSFERFLVDIIDQLDLSCFHNTSEDLGGKTPYDPRALLGIIFYSYCHGIFSARKMQKNCIYNIAYMFVSGYNTPEHTTISRFLNNSEEPIIDLFSKILYLADKSGFIDYNLIAIDGTKIKANASERFVGKIEDFKKREEKLQQNIKKAIERQKNAESDDKKDYWKKKEDNYKKDKEKISDFLKDAKKVMTKKNSEAKQNISETDSRIMKFNKGAFASGYNAQAASCDKSGIIIAVDISNAVSDTENFSPMIEKVQSSVPDEKKATIKDSKFLFDNGYHSTENLLKADENNIDAYIADGQSKKIFGNDNDKKKSKKKFIGSKDCNLTKNEEGIFLTCPEGKKITEYQIGKKNDSNFYRFIVDECEKCKCCKNYDICVGKYKKSQQRKEFKIDVKIIDNYEILKKYSEKLYSDEGKMIYSRRMPTIERVFAYIKGKLGLTSFSRKGIRKAEVEWTLGCIAHNLVRMFNLTAKEI